MLPTYNFHLSLALENEYHRVFVSVLEDSSRYSRTSNSDNLLLHELRVSLRSFVVEDQPYGRTALIDSDSHNVLKALHCKAQRLKNMADTPIDC